MFSHIDSISKFLVSYVTSSFFLCQWASGIGLFSIFDNQGHFVPFKVIKKQTCDFCNRTFKNVFKIHSEAKQALNLCGSLKDSWLRSALLVLFLVTSFVIKPFYSTIPARAKRNILSEGFIRVGVVFLNLVCAIIIALLIFHKRAYIISSTS